MNLFAARKPCIRCKVAVMTQGDKVMRQAWKDERRICKYNTEPYSHPAFIAHGLCESEDIIYFSKAQPLCPQMGLY